MRHPALELGQPGRPKCPNAYNEESTSLVPGCKRLILQVSLQAVFIQLGVFQQGRGSSVAGVQWQTEDPWLPVVGSLGRDFDAVRVRNYTAGAEAQVLLSFA